MIGCDLNERYCQISYYNEKTQEPQTVENVNYPVPDLFTRVMRQESNEDIRMFAEFMGKLLSGFGEIGQLVFTVPYVNVDIDPMTQFTTFNSYFTDEINHSDLKVVKCGITDSNQNYILFSNSVQYTYVPENKGIYRNKVKICNNIDRGERRQKVINKSNNEYLWELVQESINRGNNN